MSVQKLRQTDLLSATDAATLLDVSPDTVRRWTRNGKVPHVRLPSGRVRYRKADIEALLSPVEADSSSDSVDDDTDGSGGSSMSLDVPFPGLVGV